MLWHTEPIIHLEHTILPLSDHLRPFPPQIARCRRTVIQSASPSFPSINPLPSIMHHAKSSNSHQNKTFINNSLFLLFPPNAYSATASVTLPGTAPVVSGPFLAAALPLEAAAAARFLRSSSSFFSLLFCLRMRAKMRQHILGGSFVD